ncbi:hypothetical protein [Leptospira levettii]|nr:hypothetical protein [Leptospira levettii]
MNRKRGKVGRFRLEGIFIPSNVPAYLKVKWENWDKDRFCLTRISSW